MDSEHSTESVRVDTSAKDLIERERREQAKASNSNRYGRYAGSSSDHVRRVSPPTPVRRTPSSQPLLSLPPPSVPSSQQPLSPPATSVPSSQQPLTPPAIYTPSLQLPASPHAESPHAEEAVSPPLLQGSTRQPCSSPGDVGRGEERTSPAAPGTALNSLDARSLPVQNSQSDGNHGNSEEKEREQGDEKEQEQSPAERDSGVDVGIKEEPVLNADEENAHLSKPMTVRDGRVIKGNLVRLSRSVKILNDKVDSLVDIGIWSDTCDDLRNIVHSVLSHLEEGKMVPSVLDNKLAPLKRVMAEGVHKRCVAKLTMDSLAKVCEGDTIDVEMLNNFAAVIRTVMYSTNSGGRKEYHGDNDEMQADNRELRRKLTYLCINYMQRDEKVGRVVLMRDDEEVVVDKPFWMSEGFTKGKHITQFFNTKRGKKKTPEDDDETYLQYHIIKKINDIHSAAFNKIRDRVRVDGMKELWFLFEEVDFKYVSGPTERQEFMKLSDIPLVNVSNLTRKEKDGVLRKIWQGMWRIVDDRLTYFVEFEVVVRGKSGRRVLRRQINLVAICTMLLLRMTSTATLNELMLLNKKTLRVVTVFAELVRHQIGVHKDEGIMNKLEMLESDDPDSHLIRLIQDIRPTKSVTRKEMLKSILEMDQDQYDHLNYVPEADDSSEEGSHKSVDRLVPADDEDGLDEELGDTIQFLLTE